MLAGWRQDPVTVTAGRPAEDDPPTMVSHASALLRRLPPVSSLVGFSLGGLLALELVAQAPERFDRLALVCAGAGAEPPEGAAARRAAEAAARIKGVPAHVRDDLIPRYALREPDGATARTLVDMAATLGLDTYRRQNDLAVSRLDSRPRLGRIGVPVLLVSGAADPLCPPLRHAEIEAAFPNAKRAIVAGCGHMLPLEMPGYLRRLLVELLDR